MDPNVVSYNYATPTTNTAGKGIAVGFVIFYWVAALLTVVATWKIYRKAGKPGWAAIVPIYNLIVLLDIVGRPTWWLILLLIPIVNIGVIVVLAIDLAKSFGKSAAYGVIMLFLLSVIGYLMLAFGKAQYIGPAAKTGGAAKPQAPPVTPAQA